MNQKAPPASSAEVSALLQVLFDSLPFQRGTNTEKVAAAYLHALYGFSAKAIEEGIARFLRGEVADVSPRYIPTPPELAKIVREAARPPEPPRSIPRQFEREEHVPRIPRMKLKYPMFSYAFPDPHRMNQLAQANAEGFGAMVVLAMNWGVPIPQELLEMIDVEAEREWCEARNRALREIERNPPPYMRKSA